MRNRVTGIVTTGLFLAACGYETAEPVYLDFAELPNRAVTAINSSSTEIELDVAGNPELVEQNRQRGISFPVRFTSYKTQTLSTRTGPAREDGSFDFERTFQHAASYSENEHGKRIPMPDSMDQLVGLVVKGVIDGSGKMVIEDIEGGKLDANTEDLIRSFMESAVAVETAPEDPLRIGDSFTTEVPFDMPVPGQAPIHVQSSADYTLKRLEGDKAIFDIDMTFAMEGPPQGVRIKANAEGSGVMEYDVKARLREKLDLEMVMDMEFRSGGAVVWSKMRSTTSMEQYLTRPGGESPASSPRAGEVASHPGPAG